MAKLRVPSKYAVVPCHPVGKNVVNSGPLGQPLSSTVQQEGAALPQEVCAHSIYYGDWGARPVFATGGIARIASPIHPFIPVRPAQPVIQQITRLSIPTGRPCECSVNHIEVGVAVVISGSAH